MKTNRSKMKQALNSIVGAILIAFTTFAAYTRVHDYQLAKRSEHWPTTLGTIVSHCIHTSSSRYSTSYSPAIKYSYRVNEKDYTSDTVRYPSVRFNKYSQAAEFVSKYPIYSRVSIYYDPANPSLSCLEMSNLNYPDQERTYIISSVALFSFLFILGLACVLRIGLKS